MKSIYMKATQKNSRNLKKTKTEDFALVLDYLTL